MFRKLPGPVGYSGGRLGLWEYQSENEATELIRRREESGGAVEEDPHDLSAAFLKASPNAGRQIRLDRK